MARGRRVRGELIAGLPMVAALIGCGTGGGPCATGNGGCDPLTTCTASASGPTCSPCPVGYAGTGETGCVEPLACAQGYLDAAAQATVPLEVNVPSTCGSTPAVCCPGGVAQDPCGPLELDPRAQAGDLPRVEVTRPIGGHRLDVTLRARVRTVSELPIAVPVVGDCGLQVNTAPGPTPDVTLQFQIDEITGDPQTRPYVSASSAMLQDLTADDFALTGSYACEVASLGLTYYSGIVADRTLVAVQTGLCAVCPCKPVPY